MQGGVAYLPSHDPDSPARLTPGTLVGKRQDTFGLRITNKSRYATIGFSDQANLDDGAIWPIAFALKQLTGAEETRIAALVKKAVE